MMVAREGEERYMVDKQVIIIGATGMVGGLALRYALASPEVASVVTIGRRATGVTHDKLEEVVHGDYLDWSPVAEHLAHTDVALFCVGAYTGAVPDDEFRRITVDYTVAFAEALRRESPGVAFCLLSGAGADQTERSRMAFARYKGMAENALVAMGFSRLHLFRPGYIYPVQKRREPNLTYRLTRALYPVLRRVYPSGVIPSDALARVMAEVGLHGSGDHPGPVLENKQIRSLAGE